METDSDRQKKIGSLEMFIWARMEKNGWLDKVTNDEVLRRVNEDTGKY